MFLNLFVALPMAHMLLQRQIFLQESGPKYWDKLDTSLATICMQAKGNAKKITKFVFLLMFPSISSELLQGLSTTS
jgi:hypothetical protein